MFLRFVTQSMRRAPRRKLVTVAAVALGSAVATAMLGVMLDIGDRVNRELRGLGANLMVTAKARALPVEIGGVSYSPVSRDDFIPDSQIIKIKSTFWHLNITGFAPSLKSTVALDGRRVPVEGVWFDRRLRGADGAPVEAGLRTVATTWTVDGQWIDDHERNDTARDCMLGAALARRLGMHPGDSVQLHGQPFAITGLLSTGGDEEDRIFVRLEVLQNLAGRPGQVDGVRVSALTKPEDAFGRKDPAKMTPAEYDRWYCTPYISSIAHQIEEALPMAVAKPVWRVADNQGRLLGKISGLMLLITLAALASAGLTVWSVMATTVLARREEIAIMQATGASDWMVATLLSAEVAIEGAAGGLIGSWAGLLLAGWVGRSVFQTSLEIPGLLGPLVVAAAVVASLAGAATPLRRSLALQPAVALRGGL
jgi:putative ABC transport system permease protein